MDIKWLLSFQMTGWFSGGIYILLVILSIISWAIIFRKLGTFRRVRRADFLFRTTSEDDLEEIGEPSLEPSSLYLIYRKVQEFRKADEHDPDKLEEMVRILLSEYFHNLISGLPILATITSVAPFLGLLGTVWGIMLIFSKLHGQVAGVSEMVAPGVAQALITTIGGLLVAIPALFFYNYFSMVLRSLTNEAENYASRIIYLK